MSSLKVDFCSKKAARYACQRWHYSQKMSTFRNLQFGIWEDGAFIGAVVFGGGACPNIARPFGLSNLEICELTRVALKRHEVPVTRILKVCLSMLKKKCPKMRLVVSYADSAMGHSGGIYKGGNWYYLGMSNKVRKLVVNGRIEHPKTIDSRYGRQDITFLRENIDPNAKWMKVAGKYKFVYPLDKSLRPMLERLSKPYEASEVLIAT